MSSKNKKESCIYVLGLGGTIASVSENSMDEFYEQPSSDIKDLIALLPPDKNITIRYEQILQKISHEMTNDDLFLIAKKINALAKLDYVSGIVVAQGTNCIEETAYFINLVVKTKKPIVFTGSFRQSNSLGFDGLRNLYNSIIIATSPKINDIGVVLTFNDCITSARDSSKLNPSIMGDFSGNGLGLLGYVQGTSTHIAKLPQYKHTYSSEFSSDEIVHLPTTYIIYGHLGMDDFLVKAAIKNNVAGIISAGMGKGYQTKSVTEALAEASQHGIFVVRCSRSGYGLVNRQPDIDDKYGFIAGSSLSPQKARILFQFLLVKPKIKLKFSDFLMNISSLNAICE